MWVSGHCKCNLKMETVGQKIFKFLSFYIKLIGNMGKNTLNIPSTCSTCLNKSTASTA